MSRRYTNRGDKPTKSGFEEGLLAAAGSVTASRSRKRSGTKANQRHPEVIAIGADITSSVGIDYFARRFPDQFISLGIAEQNCIGVAAGLALEGKIPVFSTYGVFAALRTTDQIRVSVCYNNLHVVIGGAHAGLSVGPDGATHQALEDLAVMRVLPNMTVLSPCDATQAKIAIQHAIHQVKGPVYLRYGRAAMPDFTSENQVFEVGKAQQLLSGNDVTIIATGHLVWEALQAAYMLKEEKISARVINMHTIKPVDKEILIKAARETGAVVTAEEHQVNGGLGGAVAEVLACEYPVPMKFIGMPDRFGESGEPRELMKKYGMTDTSIV
ncbi:MAG: transketolase family protein, partial [Bacteroidia bacterium]|nr:transketolase family protein [Bacteroidia bacterium]